MSSGDAGPAPGPCPRRARAKLAAVSHHAASPASLAAGLVAGLATALVACGGGATSRGGATAPTAAASGPPTCASMTEHVLTVLAATEAPVAGADAELRQLLVTRCDADGWPADALACFSDAGDEAGLTACESTLTAAQRAAVEAEIDRVLERMMRGGEADDAAPTAAPPPPAGAPRSPAPPPPDDPCGGGA